MSLLLYLNPGVLKSPEFRFIFHWQLGTSITHKVQQQQKPYEIKACSKRVHFNMEEIQRVEEKTEEKKGKWTDGG